MIGLILPYIALVIYFAVRTLDHPQPTWFPYFGLSYLLGTTILVTVFSRKISRAAPSQTVNKPQPAQRRMLRASAGSLIAVWSGGFLWGAYQTIEGHFAWQRALPAGAFLLAFIALFSRLLYSDIKRPNQPATPADNTAERGG